MALDDDVDNEEFNEIDDIVQTCRDLERLPKLKEKYKVGGILFDSEEELLKKKGWKTNNHEYYHCGWVVGTPNYQDCKEDTYGDAGTKSICFICNGVIDEGQHTFGD